MRRCKTEMNELGRCGRKYSWSVLRYNPLEELGRTTITPVNQLLGLVWKRESPV
jgi:hypothetical protein